MKFDQVTPCQIKHTILKNILKNSFKKDTNKMITPCKMLKERIQVSIKPIKMHKVWKSRRGRSSDFCQNPCLGVKAFRTKLQVGSPISGFISFLLSFFLIFNLRSYSFSLFLLKNLNVFFQPSTFSRFKRKADTMSTLAKVLRLSKTKQWPPWTHSRSVLGLKSYFW